MGITVQQLSQTMTAQEFGQHYTLELEEPLPAAPWSLAASMLAALANGPLKSPEPGRIWQVRDLMPALWQHNAPTAPDTPAQPATVAQIMAQARAAGMVQ
jgi:hypothetical protein